jgi:branched-chain amino acid transport system ATP-binding protein
MSLLKLENITAGYGAIRVVRGISLRVEEGEIVTLIGANGAGKSTTLRAISRLIPVDAGTIEYRGASLLSLKSHSVAAAGITHVPEGRGVFGNLTVTENLKLAVFGARDKHAAVRRIAGMYDLFPVLGQRRSQIASTLSGGEQQMLAIGRAVVADGDLFMFDEPSMGLSPIMVKSVFATIAEIHKKGKAILLVEQNAAMALKYAHRAYVLENGRIVSEGTSAEIAANADLKKAYFG